MAAPYGARCGCRRQLSGLHRQRHLEHRHAKPAHGEHSRRHGEPYQPDNGAADPGLPLRRQCRGRVPTVAQRCQRLHPRARHHCILRQRADPHGSAARLALCSARSPQGRLRSRVQLPDADLQHPCCPLRGTLLPELRRPDCGLLSRRLASPLAGGPLPHSEQPAQPHRRAVAALCGPGRQAHRGHPARRRRLSAVAHHSLLGQHHGRPQRRAAADRLCHRRHRRRHLCGRGHHDLQCRRPVEPPQGAPRQRAGSHGPDARHRRSPSQHLPREPLCGALRSLQHKDWRPRQHVGQDLLGKHRQPGAAVSLHRRRTDAPGHLAHLAGHHRGARHGQRLHLLHNDPVRLRQHRRIILQR